MHGNRFENFEVKTIIAAFQFWLDHSPSDAELERAGDIPTSAHLKHIQFLLQDALEKGETLEIRPAKGEWRDTNYKPGQNRYLILSLAGGKPERKRFYTVEGKVPGKRWRRDDLAFFQHRKDRKVFLSAHSLLQACKRVLEKVLDLKEARGGLEQRLILTEAEVALQRAIAQAEEEIW
jgi:hypothetical protein